MSSHFTLFIHFTAGWQSKKFVLIFGQAFEFDSNVLKTFDFDKAPSTCYKSNEIFSARQMEMIVKFSRGNILRRKTLCERNFHRMENGLYRFLQRHWTRNLSRRNKPYYHQLHQNSRVWYRIKSSKHFHRGLIKRCGSNSLL